VGTHLDKRGVVELNEYFDESSEELRNRENFVQYREGLDLMRRIGAISYIEYSAEDNRGVLQLRFNTTQTALFCKKRTFWFDRLKRSFDYMFGRHEVPIPPPPPPIPTRPSRHPALPSEVRMGPLSLMAPNGHSHCTYGCLRNENTGIKIYYYVIQQGSHWNPEYTVVVVVVDPSAEGLQEDYERQYILI